MVPALSFAMHVVKLIDILTCSKTLIEGIVKINF